MYNEEMAAAEIKAAVVSGVDAANELHDATAYVESDAEREKREATERSQALVEQLTTLIGSAIDSNLASLDPDSHGGPIGVYYRNGTCVIVWADGYAFNLYGYEAKISTYDMEKLILTTATSNGHDLGKFGYASLAGVDRIAICANCRQLTGFSDKNPAHVSSAFYMKPCEAFDAKKVW